MMGTNRYAGRPGARKPSREDVERQRQQQREKLIKLQAITERIIDKRNQQPAEESMPTEPTAPTATEPNAPAPRAPASLSSVKSRSPRPY